MKRAEVLREATVPLSLPDVPSVVPAATGNPATEHGNGTASAGFIAPTVAQRGAKLTQQEIEVIKKGSFINNKVYIPFEATDASAASLGGAGKWEDPDGLLSLSEKQARQNPGWNRAEDVIPECTIINQISPRNVTQETG